MDLERTAFAGMSLAGSQALAVLADTNIDEMVAALGKGIAKAQFELDQMSVRVAQMMTGEYAPGVDARGRPLVDGNGRPKLVKSPSRVDFAGEKLSLLELGFTPTFYQFIETVIMVKVSVSLDADVKMESKAQARARGRSSTSASGARYRSRRGDFDYAAASRQKSRTSVQSVSSRFSARYQYSVEGSSFVRTTLVPVPPPEALLSILDVVVNEASEAGEAEAETTD